MLNDFDADGVSIVADSLLRKFALPATKDNITAVGGDSKVTLSPVAGGKPLMGAATVTATYTRVSLSALAAQFGELRIPASVYSDFAAFAKEFHRCNAIVLEESDTTLTFPLDLTDTTLTTVNVVAAANSLRFTGDTKVRIYTPASARLEFSVVVPALAAGKVVNIGYIRSGSNPTPSLFDVYIAGVKTAPIFEVASGSEQYVSVVLPQAVAAGELRIRVVSSIPFGTGAMVYSGGIEPRLINNLDYPIGTIYEVTQDGIVDTQLGFVNPTQASTAIWIDAKAFQKNRIPINISSLFANKNVMEITDGLFDNQTIVGASRAFQGSRLMSVRAGAFSKATLSGSWEYVFRQTNVGNVEEGAFPATSEITNLHGMFYNCQTLTQIPGDVVKHAGKTCVTMTGLLYGCTSLIELPSGLFAGCSVVTNMSSAVSNTGVKTLPANLLTDCVSLTTASGIFSSSKVTTVPADLFKTNTQLVDLSNVFAGTPLEAVPATLFSTLTNLSTLSYGFMNCSSLTDLPDATLSKCVNLTDLSFAFYGTIRVSKFPTGILKGLTKLTNLLSGFELCSSSTRFSSPGTFTKDLMADLVNLTDAGRAFLGCPFNKVEEGAFDSLAKVTSMGYFFGGPRWSPSGATLTTVPESLFSKCVSLTEIAGFFASTALTVIPPNLFTNMPKKASVKSLGEIFWGCSNLVNIPAGLFTGFTAVKAIDGLFGYATKVTDIPTDLFASMVNTLETVERLFSRSGLKVLKRDFLGDCTSLTSIREICSECSGLTKVESGSLSKSTGITATENAFLNATALTTIEDGPLLYATSLYYGQNMFSGCSALTVIYPSWFANVKNLFRADGLFRRSGVKEVPVGLFVNKTNITNIAYLFSECVNLRLVKAGWYAPGTQSSSVDMSNMFEKGAVDIVLEAGSMPLSKSVKVTGMFLYGQLSSQNSYAGVGGDVSRFNGAFTLPAGEAVSQPTNMFAAQYGSNPNISGNVKALMTSLGLLQSDMSTVFDNNSNIVWA